MIVEILTNGWGAVTVCVTVITIGVVIGMTLENKYAHKVVKKYYTNCTIDDRQIENRSSKEIEEI